MNENSIGVRKDFELPIVVEKWGWKYHHIGIPSNIRMPNEKYILHK